MEIKKYFFVIFFLCSMVSDQKLFCSQQLETDEDPSMMQNFGNYAESVSENLKMKELLFEQYRQFLTDLDHETFDEVFTYFINHGKQCEIECGALFDTCSIRTRFGHAVQKAVALKKEKELAVEDFFILSISDLDPETIALYQRYQELLGNFDEDLFIQVINFMAETGQTEKIVDACQKDIVKIDSAFGLAIKRIVMTRRRKKELERLSLEFKSNPRINFVVQKMLEEINTGESTVGDNFIPELLTVTFEHLVSALDNPSEGISFKRKLIDTYYDKLVEVFLYAVPEKALADYNQRQKHIKAFIAVANANAIAKLDQILTGNLTPIKRAFKDLHQKELSKINQMQQLSSGKTKQAAEQYSSSIIENNPSPAVAVAQPAAVAQELSSTEIFARQQQLWMKDKNGTMRALDKEQELEIQRILEQVRVSFEQIQQKEQQVLTGQADAALVEINQQEQQGCQKVYLGFLEACHNMIKGRLQSLLSNKFTKIQEEAKQEFSQIKDKENREALMREKLYLKICENKAVSDFNRAQRQKRAHVIGKMNSSFSKLMKKEKKELVSYCLAFLEKYQNALEIESKHALEQFKKTELREQVLQRAIAGYRHNPYSSHTFQEEKEMHFLLKKLYLENVNSSDSTIPSLDEDWHPTGYSSNQLPWNLEENYQWVILSDGSLCCLCPRLSNEVDNMFGKICSNRKTFVFDHQSEKWIKLCIESAL